MDLNHEIIKLEEKFELDLFLAKQSGKFDELYLKYFSKTKGLTTLLVKKLPELTTEDKKEFGPLINALQEKQQKRIEQEKYDYELALRFDPAIDLTLHSQPRKTGFLHPTTQVIRETNFFFRYYGFSVAQGPEIENTEYNFTRLNLPENHPATDLQDTLFIKQPDILLRTHTSSVEARVLSNYKPPIRIVVPGKCYRNETANKSNNSFFYQYQGVVVDEGITVQHLKEMINKLFRFLFGENIKIRYRYKYYPEVSPGMGADIECSFCAGRGCDVCKGRGWFEMGGSGMIHYNTLKMCGINPEIYTGFAFGMGLDRFVMSKFNIADIRKLYGGRVVYK